MSRLDDLIRRRAEERRRRAAAGIALVLEECRRHDIEVTVIGSMANGRFRAHSDIDLLVGGEMRPARRAFVERMVADRLRGSGIPYDLVFACDLHPDRVQEFLDDIVQTSRLCETVSEDRQSGA